MFSWAYYDERRQYESLKRVHFNSEKFSDDPSTNIITNQNLMKHIEKAEEIILECNEYHRNGNKIDEKKFVDDMKIPVNALKEGLEKVIANRKKQVDSYKFNKNRYEQVKFKNNTSCNIQEHKCFNLTDSVGYDYHDYIYGHKSLLVNHLMPSLEKNKKGYQESADLSSPIFLFSFLWRIITFPYYRGKMSSYVTNYEKMIDTVQLLKQEIESSYNKINDIYKQIAKAQELLNSKNPNLISFTTRYLSFLDKCGKGDKPLIQTLSVEELTEFKNVLKEWYNSNNKN